MTANPISDFLPYLTNPVWTTAVFWLLLLAGAALAIASWRRVPPLRPVEALGLWIVRMALGVMWWQGSIWKVPPGYDGLIHWMQQIVDHALIPLHAKLVRDIVLPNISLFGPMVYGTEVAIAASFLLGAFTRVGALLGLALTGNLLLGLYSAPGEWPWTYGFLILLQIVFLVGPIVPGFDMLRRLRSRRI